MSKTSVAGIVKAIVACLGVGGVVVSPELADKITAGAVAVWIVIDIIQAKFTKDA